MQPTETLPLCIYLRHEGDIHEFILQDSSRAAFEDYMTLFEQIYEDDRQAHRFMVDLSAGLPSMTYAFNRMKQFMRRADDRPRRVALMHNAHVLLTVAQSFVQLLGSSATIRFFNIIEREEALSWLREDIPVSQPPA